MTQKTEGFTNHLKITSENLDGELIIDGWWRHNISLGESFTIRTAGEE